MTYIGIIPSESSTGNTAKQYCHKARISQELLKKTGGLAKDVIDIPWKAPKKLCKRFMAFVMWGKHKTRPPSP